MPVAKNGTWTQVLTVHWPEFALETGWTTLLLEVISSDWVPLRD